MARDSPVRSTRSARAAGRSSSGAEHGHRLVEDADPAYTVHTARLASHICKTARDSQPMASTHPEREGLGPPRRARPRPASPTCSTSICTSSTRSPARRPSTASASRAARVRRPDLTVATADHNVPTEDIDKPVADPISAKQLEVLAHQHRRVRHHPLRDGRPEPGHRPRDRPRAGPHAAGHDHRVRRQPHLHPRCLRRAGLRHRHQRGRARARHPDPPPAAPGHDGGHRRRRAARRAPPPRT